jgi:hypothetical protein
MKSRVGMISAAAMVAILAAPLALAANPTEDEAFTQKAIAGNPAEQAILPDLRKHLQLAESLARLPSG